MRLRIDAGQMWSTAYRNELVREQHQARRREVVRGYKPARHHQHRSTPNGKLDIAEFMEQRDASNSPHVKVKLGHTARLLPDSPAVSSHTRPAHVCGCGLETAEPRNAKRCYADR